jgi:hypothetical protein
VCPHGGGYDTHRLWECLVLGAWRLLKPVVLTFYTKTCRLL